MLRTTGNIMYPVKVMKDGVFVSAAASGKDLFFLDGSGCVFFVRGETDRVKSVFRLLGLGFHKNVRMIYGGAKMMAASQHPEGFVVVLKRDGTCDVAASAKDGYVLNKAAQNEIRELRDVVHISMSDCLYAVHSDGRVSVVPVFSREAPYEVKGWRDIVKTVPGAQNGVIGITKDGKLRYSGYNIKHDTGLCRWLDEACDVVDACIVGSECEQICYVNKNGDVFRDGSGPDEPAMRLGDVRGDVFASHYAYGVVCVDGHGDCHVLQDNDGNLHEVNEWRGVGKVAIGWHTDAGLFAVATKKQR